MFYFPVLFRALTLLWSDVVSELVWWGSIVWCSKCFYGGLLIYVINLPGQFLVLSINWWIREKGANPEDWTEHRFELLTGIGLQLACSSVGSVQSNLIIGIGQLDHAYRLRFMIHCLLREHNWFVPMEFFRCEKLRARTCSFSYSPFLFPLFFQA